MQNHVALPKALATKECVIGISYHGTRYFLFYILSATIKTIRQPINDLFDNFSNIENNNRRTQSVMNQEPLFIISIWHYVLHRLG